MSALLLVAAWFGMGAAGYFLTRHWWTRDFDWTTSERAMGLVFALTGPLNILISLLVIGMDKLESRPRRVLVKRRDS